MATVRKVDIAKHYLEDALRLYSNGRFLSALTLAGAAEEMFGKFLERSVPIKVGGLSLRPVSAHDKEAKALYAFDQQFVGTQYFLEKNLDQIKKELNTPRNSAKHFNDPNESTFNFDQQLEAGCMIIRTIRNYRIAFPDTDDRYDYEEEDISVDQMNKLNPFGLA